MNENLYDYTFKRKSNRKYDMTPLSNDQLAKIKAYADSLQPLYENIKVEYVLTNDVRNVLPILAPHYLLIYSEKKAEYLRNVGFMFEQLDLFLSSEGLGACWLGMARPSEKTDTSLEFVIALAFGKTIGSPYRELSGFKRKPLSEISVGSDDRLACARLAPSAVNSQNWFFVCDNGKIHIYEKKSNAIATIMYNKMNNTNMGIVLCHLYVATVHQGKAFTFSQDSAAKELKGYAYIGTVL